MVEIETGSKGPFIATQFNSTRRWVELRRYKRPFSVTDTSLAEQLSIACDDDGMFIAPLQPSVGIHSAL